MSPPYLLRAVSERAFRSRSLARVLFGVKPLPEARPFSYFDVTTYVLSRRASRLVSSSDCVLDLGSGPHAMLGLYLWKTVGCRVICADRDETMVGLSRQAVALNEAPIEVVQSTFFSGVEDDFDTVTFNPPYVKSDGEPARLLSPLTQTMWDGGSNGTDVIDGFLAAIESHDRPVAAHMGLNNMHVSTEAVLKIIARYPHVTLTTLFSHRLLPVSVYSVHGSGL